MLAIEMILFGILFVIIGTGAIFYGVSKRSAALEELAIDELRSKYEKRKLSLRKWKRLMLKKPTANF
jgi:hypothetical protein